ncbi:MAG: hydroxylamine reductase [Planctomycetes bacterium]|nr:hydroxylamine reductase [Planctomycetota bacterium]MBU4399960.1 hydroxylamine reductase [Planctomycetota bacterium]MCG2684984.1 hydroxylamine reductase [Planctomycetales bacterium]
MYCYQCEQTAKGAGCTVIGVCGKEPAIAALQDLLIHATKGIAMYAHRAAELDATDQQVDRAIIEFLFATVTNVDFDPQRLKIHLLDAAAIRERAKTLYEDTCVEKAKAPEVLDGPAAWQPAADLDGLIRQGDEVSITKRQTRLGNDAAGLQDLILYGLKGAASYADHAMILGYEDPNVYATFHQALDFLAQENPTQDALLDWAMKTGELNLTVMGLLDAANTSTYGHPEPTAVRVTPVRGKCLLVSGHDLKDLDELLRQTEGKGINVYTHGEMLPCHAYPGLKKHKHLVGNYGGAWQDQRKEFDEFPGAILMTTNCIQKPKESYIGRIFTSGLVAWPGVRHTGPDRDFSPVIEAALAADGFATDAPEQTITVGFGHHAVLGVADKVVAAVKAGRIRHFFLVGGCDGAKSGRNYYTEFAQKVPEDCVILTLACGKYRFNKLPFGSIDGVPRLLDVGQCNDAFSAIQIATTLADAFKCEVNQLPLSMVLSWYEQKAVAILLTLLYLGIKNIRLGPSLPAFVTPPVLKLLVEKFNIAPIATPEADLKAILG